MRIISWNVNGLAAAIRKGLLKHISGNKKTIRAILS